MFTPAASRSAQSPTRAPVTDRAKNARESRAVAQRARVEDAVERAVEEHGFAQATLADIILNAGISTKTFYKHFSDKPEAFRSAMRRHAELAFESTRAAGESRASWPERVHASLSQLLAFILENPNIARMCIVEMQTAGPEAIAELQRWLRRYADSLAPHGSEISMNTPVRTGLADQVAGAISQLIYDNINNGDLENLTDLLPDLLEIALAPYIGPRQAADFIAAVSHV